MVPRGTKKPPTPGRGAAAPAEGTGASLAGTWVVHSGMTSLTFRLVSSPRLAPGVPARPADRLRLAPVAGARPGGVGAVGGNAPPGRAAADPGDLPGRGPRPRGRGSRTWLAAPWT